MAIIMLVLAAFFHWVSPAENVQYLAYMFLLFAALSFIFEWIEADSRITYTMIHAIAAIAVAIFWFI